MFLFELFTIFECLCSNPYWTPCFSLKIVKIRKNNETVGVYSLEAKITSCGYYVYKKTSWSKARDEEEVKIDLEMSLDPYACAIRAKEEYFKG